jgi:hypothetical protein
MATALAVSACDRAEVAEAVKVIGFNTSVELAQRQQPLTSRGDHLRGRVLGEETEETRRRFFAVEGDEIALDYDVQLERGRIWIVVEEAIGSRDVWEVRMEHRSGRDGVIFRIPAAGAYNLVVFRWRFGGSYDVKWRKL